MKEDIEPEMDIELEIDRMLFEQIESRYISDSVVLDAMKKVPRHLFVPEKMQPFAYQDRPLSIGYGQTISQPYIVALMTDSLQLTGVEKILEIGTGSGYQTAVLAQIAFEIYTIEIVPELFKLTKSRFEQFGYTNIKVKFGDGYYGWAEYAKFDAVIVTCAPEKIPPMLKEQLKIGGKMVIPVGAVNRIQKLLFLQKIKEREFIEREILAVSFVPMTGQAKIK